MGNEQQIVAGRKEVAEEGDYDNEGDFDDELDILDEYSVREHPHDCIGFLSMRNALNELIKGTGFLIAPDLVLTSAHNVYSRLALREYTDLKFHPGVSGQIPKSAIYNVVAVRYPQLWRTAEKDMPEHDYALLKLDRKVPREAYIPLGLDYIQQEEPIGIFGYTKCSPTMAMQDGLWKPEAHTADLPVIRHRLTTSKGNSGSPLLVKRDGKFVAVAIHKGSRKGASHSVATAITPAILQNLMIWQKEMTS
jgi:V8-like Glu-specific endopeptidase